MRKKSFMVLSPILGFITYLSLSSYSTPPPYNSFLIYTGCLCHNFNVDTGTTISFNGLPVNGYINDSLYTFTITVTNHQLAPALNGSGLSAGFDLYWNGGSTYPSAGMGYNSLYQEIFHGTALPLSGGSASWTLQWRAPASGNSNAAIGVMGLVGNGDLTDSGDAWNTGGFYMYKAGQPLAVTAIAPSGLSCNGGVTYISATGFGPGEPFEYKLNNNPYQVNSSFGQVTAGAYTVTIKDANGLTATTALTITQPPPIIVNTTASPVLCPNGLSTLNVTAISGTSSPITNYALNNGPYQSTPVFNALSAGVYTVTARNTSGCTGSTIVTIAQPSPIAFNLLIQAEVCGTANGSITMNGSGGTPPYQYSIEPPVAPTNTNGIFTGLTAQAYTISAIDANACSASTVVTVNASNNIVVTATDVIACLGDSVLLTGSPAGGTVNLPNPYAGNANYFVYTYNNGNGCAGSDTGHIERQQVVLDNMKVSPGSVCAGGYSLLSISPANQDCIPVNYNNGCFGQEYINLVQLGSINQNSSCGNTGYTDNSQTAVTTLSAGTTYTITLGDGAYFPGDQWGVWIDYNQNGVLGDAGEFTGFAATGPVTQFPITIPNSAINGPMRMRVRLVFVGPMSPCGSTTFGEAEDYGIIMTGGINNTAPPFTYLWTTPQYSQLSHPHQKTTLAYHIESAETYTVTVTSAEGCQATATGSVSTYSMNLVDSARATPDHVCPPGTAVLSMQQVDSVAIYCSPSNVYNGCSGQEYIQQVTLSNLNHLSVCDSIAYKDYTNLSASLLAGNTYTITLGNGAFFPGDQWGVWIDYNHNGNFTDPAEEMLFTPTGSILNGEIHVPAFAYDGPTRMRVRLQLSGTPSPCGTSVFGEIEDYTVIISGGTPSPAYMTYTWSNNLHSTLSNTNGISTIATDILADEQYHITATRIDGCKETVIVPVIIDTTCGVSLQLNVFLEGYYSGNGVMAPVLMNQGIGNDSSNTDSIRVALHNAQFPYQEIAHSDCILHTNGDVFANFPGINGSYYIVVKLRNGLETWSAQAMNLNGNVTYTFSNDANKAFGANQVEVSPGLWAMYSGDLNHDENIDLLDIGMLETDINNFVFGYYNTDINGDGNVDLLDIPVLEKNINAFVFSVHP